MSPVEDAVLRSVVAPAVVAGIAITASGGLEAGPARKVQSGALALCFALGAWLLIGHLTFPPADVNETFSYVAVLLGLFALVAPVRSGQRYAVRAVFVLIGLAAIVWHIRGTLTDSAVHIQNLLAFFCLSLGAWSLGESNAQRAGKPAVIVAGFLSIVSVSIVALLGGSAVVANLAGTLAGQLGAALTVACVLPKRVSIDAVLPFTTAFVGLFAAAAHFYLDINPWHLFACLFPIGVLAIVRHLPLPRQPLFEAAVVAILSAIPLGFFLRYLFSISGPLY